METLIVLGLAYNQVPLVMKARQMGYHTVAVGKGGGYPAVAECVDEWFPIDTTDFESVMRLAQRYDTAGLATSGTSTAQCTVSYVNDKLGLSDKVIPYSTAVNAVFKDKARGVIGDLMPRGFSASDVDEAVKLSGDLNYPLLVKPGDGGGGKGITILAVSGKDRLSDALDYALDFSRSKVVIVEEYLDGRVFGAESIILDGHIYLLAVPEKIITEPPRCVTLGITFPPQITPELSERLALVNRQTIERLGIRWGATHIDMALDRSGYPLVIDVGPRLAGGALMASLVPDAYDYDCYRAVIEMAVGKTPADPGSYNGKYYGSRFLVTPKTGVLKAVRYSKQVVDGLQIGDIRQLIRDGSRLDGVNSYSSRLMIYTAKGDSFEDVTTRLDRFGASVEFVIE